MLPAALQSNLTAFLVALATQLDGLPDAIRKRNEMLEAFENESADQEEDETSFASSSAGVNVDTSGFEDVDDDHDVLDEENEYMEMFARERAKLRARANGEELEDDEDEDDEFVDEDDEDDELSYESPMDAVPVFEQFRQLLTSYQSERPDVWAKIAAELTADQMQLIQQAAEGKDERVKTL